jgi:hypothetical protein
MDNDKIITDIVKDTDTTVWIRTKGAAMGLVQANYGGGCKFAGDVAVHDKNGDKGWRMVTLSFAIDYGDRDSPGEIEEQVRARLAAEIRTFERDSIIKELRGEIYRLKEHLSVVENSLNVLRCKHFLFDAMEDADDNQ